MLILCAKITLNGVICMILFIFSMIIEFTNYSETLDFMVRFYSFMLQEISFNTNNESQ